MYPVAVFLPSFFLPPFPHFSCCVYISLLLRMGRRKKKLGIHAINLLIYLPTHTQQCIVGATLRLEGGGKRRVRRRRRRNIFLFGLHTALMVAWERRHIPPSTLCRFPFRVYSISRVRGLFEPASQWQKKNPSHLITRVPDRVILRLQYFLSTPPTSIFCLFFFFSFFLRPSFQPSASRNFHYWFHFVWFSPLFCSVLFTYMLMALKVI